MYLLSELAVGEAGRITNIEGGRGIRHRLLLRGITEGSSFRMVSSNGGPIVVEIGRNTVAIGRGMAQRILVSKGKSDN